jgi:hypothetical protein
MISFKSGWKQKAPTIDQIGKQLLEKRPLPQGANEFEEWSDRIISGALITADTMSLKYALANMIMHLGPTESHKEDAFFIHNLRKSAANQVAHAKIEEYKAAYNERVAKDAALALVEKENTINNQ